MFRNLRSVHLKGYVTFDEDFSSFPRCTWEREVFFLVKLSLYAPWFHEMLIKTFQKQHCIDTL